MSVLEERLKPKPSANGHSMDIDYTIEGQDKESYLQILHQKSRRLRKLNARNKRTNRKTRVGPLQFTKLIILIIN